MALCWGHDETLRLWDLASGRLSEGCAENPQLVVYPGGAAFFRRSFSFASFASARS